MNAKKYGFTLVELAIVLVIIGLIVGGVLVGRDLIHNAELRNIANQEQKFVVAVHTFHLKYGGLPGDITNATSYWSTATNGDGNGQVGSYSSSDPSAPESFFFWQELANAGLIEGNYSGNSYSNASLPMNKAVAYSVWWAVYLDTYTPGQLFVGSYGHILSFTGTNATGAAYFTPIGSGTHIRSPQPTLRAEDVYDIDSKLDDGDAAAGAIVVQDTGGISNDACTDAVDQTATTAHYQTQNTTISCGVVWRNAF
jgi:prepilin-type N-terminal cleavage/methylation domain-containing protein